jgi:hypothetical protein
MKKMYLVFAAIFIMAMIVARESAFSQDQNNYYTICSNWEAYFNSNPDLKLAEDGGYAAFVRWKEFWRTRVNNGDLTQKGSFNLYRQALDDYSAHLSTYQRPTTVFSDWHSLGPRQQDILAQNIGQVCSIYVDTVSDKTMRTIYIGTNSSGIWRTTDGGRNWNNITDNTSSVNGIVINGVTDITGGPEQSGYFVCISKFWIYK